MIWAVAGEKLTESKKPDSTAIHTRAWVMAEPSLWFSCDV
jgi:hypothetical protein